MTDAETAAHLRRWVARGQTGPFAWPTDACGYEQHLRFVKHRNEHYEGGDFGAFVLAYADMLDPEGAEP